MSFFERFADLCAERGLDPCSATVEAMIGIKKTTISSWKTRNTYPKGENVAAIADAFHVSADYLLERTDDPPDYTDGDFLASLDAEILAHAGGDPRRALAMQKARDEDGLRENAKRLKAEQDLLRKIRRFDTIDREKLDAYLEGLLSADKYDRTLQAKNA